MAEPVKRRPYRAPRRRAAAQRTRRVILEAAARLFVERGYPATTMAAIAEAAGVALDTVYASVGPKPVLFRLLVETAISGAAEPVPALERDYVHAMRAEPDPRRKLELYAGAIRRIQGRLAPLFRVLQGAAPAHPELAALWTEIAERRAGNMRMLAQELAETGGLREDISVEEAADLIWAMNSSEFYALLVLERAWDPERFEHWLAAAWQRLLLRRV
jgi:AcrR family transcriptional regulator